MATLTLKSRTHLYDEWKKIDEGKERNLWYEHGIRSTIRKRIETDRNGWTSDDTRMDTEGYRGLDGRFDDDDL